MAIADTSAEITFSIQARRILYTLWQELVSFTTPRKTPSDSSLAITMILSGLHQILGAPVLYLLQLQERNPPLLCLKTKGTNNLTVYCRLKGIILSILWLGKYECEERKTNFLGCDIVLVCALLPLSPTRLMLWPFLHLKKTVAVNVWLDLLKLSESCMNTPILSSFVIEFSSKDTKI